MFTINSWAIFGHSTTWIWHSHLNRASIFNGCYQGSVLQGNLQSLTAIANYGTKTVQTAWTAWAAELLGQITQFSRRKSGVCNVGTNRKYIAYELVAITATITSNIENVSTKTNAWRYFMVFSFLTLNVKCSEWLKTRGISNQSSRWESRMTVR